MQNETKRKAIKIITDQKIVAANKAGSSKKRSSEALDSPKKATKKLMVIELDDNLPSILTRTDEESAGELVDALQKLRNSQEVHMLQHMRSFSVPPPNISIPPPMTSQPTAMQYRPLTPHTFYPRPPFFIKRVNRGLVMRTEPRTAIVEAAAPRKVSSITDVPLSELMMRPTQSRSNESPVPQAVKVYEVSRGNPWMRSPQSVYHRPPFPSRAYRRAIMPNVGGNVTRPQPNDEKTQKMDLLDYY